MKKQIAAILGSVLLVTFGTVGVAQVGKPSVPGQMPPVGASALGAQVTDGTGQSIQFDTKLKAIDSQLAKIEALFGQIEGARETAAKERYSDDLDKSLSAYAKAMTEAYDTALQRAELAAKSQGKEGDVEQLNAFERLAKGHEERLKTLDQRGKKITGSANTSSISEPADRVTVGWSLQILEKISDVLISPAQAMIALTAYNACHHTSGQTWTQAQQAACAAAIVKAASDGAGAHTVFNSCWSSYENTRPKWWRAILRTGCATALVVRLA